MVTDLGQMYICLKAKVAPVRRKEAKHYQWSKSFKGGDIFSLGDRKQGSEGFEIRIPEVDGFSVLTM